MRSPGSGLGPRISADFGRTQGNATYVLIGVRSPGFGFLAGNSTWQDDDGGDWGDDGDDWCAGGAGNHKMTMDGYDG